MKNNVVTDKLRVAFYIRVSTTEQDTEGYSIEAQIETLQKFIMNRDDYVWKPEWVFKDIHTGSDVNRKGLNSMLEAIKNNEFDAVIVWKIDRLSRSLQHLLALFEKFKAHNVSFVSIQENLDFSGPIGQLIFQIFGAIAEFERELIRGRTHFGKVASARTGNFIRSHTPYGYKKVKRQGGGKGKILQVIPEEQKWVRKIFDWYVYEDMGDRSIAKRLNREAPQYTQKEQGRASKKWTEEIVRNILLDDVYTGTCVLVKHDEQGSELPLDEWVTANTPEIISKIQFLQVEELRKERVGGNRADYLLSGKLRDTVLEPSMGFTGAGRTKGGHSYRRKKCTRDGIDIPVFEIAGRQLDDIVWKQLMHAMKQPEAFIQHHLGNKTDQNKRIDRLEDDLHNLRVSRSELELKEVRAEDAMLKGTYSAEKYAVASEKINEQVGEINASIHGIEKELSALGQIQIETKKLKQASEKLKYRLENLNPKQKQILCRLFVDRVDVTYDLDLSKERNKYSNVELDVKFRFNPDLIMRDGRGVCTFDGLQVDKKPSNKSKNDISGAADEI